MYARNKILPMDECLWSSGLRRHPTNDILKFLAHEMDLAFDDMHGLF